MLQIILQLQDTQRTSTLYQHSSQTELHFVALLPKTL